MAKNKYWKGRKTLLKGYGKKGAIKGIYKITHKNSGKFYIGSAIDVYKRFEWHKYELLHKKHSNYKLQDAYAKSGIGVFVFEILQEVPKNTDRIDLYNLEQKYIDDLKPEYNIQLIVEIPQKLVRKRKVKILSHVKEKPPIVYVPRKIVIPQIKQKVKLTYEEKQQNRMKKKLKNYDVIKAFNDKQDEMRRIKKRAPA